MKGRAGSFTELLARAACTREGIISWEQRAGTSVAARYLHDELPRVGPRHRRALAGSEDADSPDVESSGAEVTAQHDALEQRFAASRHTELVSPAATRATAGGELGEKDQAACGRGQSSPRASPSGEASGLQLELAGKSLAAAELRRGPGSRGVAAPAHTQHRQHRDGSFLDKWLGSRTPRGLPQRCPW